MGALAIAAQQLGLFKGTARTKEDTQPKLPFLRIFTGLHPMSSVSWNSTCMPPSHEQRVLEIYLHARHGEETSLCGGACYMADSCKF